MVISLAKVSCPSKVGQGDATMHGGREKENQMTPMLLAGLISTASKVKKSETTLADMAKMKLEGQLDVVEYSRITVPESVHMGSPAGGYMEMVKAKNSATGHMMTLHDKQAMQEGSNLERKEYGTVMSSEANENGLELLNKISWRVALPKFFDETMRTPSSVMAYIANPCVRTDLRVRLVWCLIGMKKRGVRSHHRDEGNRTAAETDASCKSADRQGRFGDSIVKTEGHTLREICGGLYPHSGAKRMCEDNQAEVDEA